MDEQLQYTLRTRFDFPISTLLQAVAQVSSAGKLASSFFSSGLPILEACTSQTRLFPCRSSLLENKLLWPEFWFHVSLYPCCVCHNPTLSMQLGNAYRKQAGRRTEGGGVREPQQGVSSCSVTCWQYDLRQIPSAVQSCFLICKSLLYFPLLQPGQAYH